MFSASIDLTFTYLHNSFEICVITSDLNYRVGDTVDYAENLNTILKINIPDKVKNSYCNELIIITRITLFNR